MVLGNPYNGAIDMWSLGCMAAELYLGLPLFPGACEHDLLSRITEMFGPLPQDLLDNGNNTAKFFEAKEEISLVKESDGMRVRKAVKKYRLRTKEEFEKHNQQEAPQGTCNSLVCHLNT